MGSVNERLQDALISHQVGLQGYSNGLVRRIIAQLNRTDADLFAQLARALDALPVSAFTVERLEQLLASVRQLNAVAYQTLGRALSSEMRALVEHEAGFQLDLFTSTVPSQVIAQMGLAQVSVDQVYSAALARPFQGRLLSEWSSSLQADRATRIRDAIRHGYIENQSIPEIVRRVRGTRALGYSDGVIEIDRRNAESVVRTAVSHTAGFTRDRFFDENDDLIKAVVWVATLDSRTSPICRARDGKKYSNTGQHRPIDHSLPWLGGPGRAHWQCRSTSVPVTKSFRELGIDLEELPPAKRASMDGEVPADLTYGEWLKKQSPKRQDDVLGASRAALFRSGGLPIEKFVNDKGKLLTLAELKKLDRKAFEDSGLTLPIKPPRGVPKDEIVRFLASPAAQEALLRDLHGSESGYRAAVEHVTDAKAAHRYRSSVPSLTAIRHYTGSGYAPINQRMRDAGGTLADRQFTALAADGIEGMPVNARTIWRAPSRRRGSGDRWWDKAEVGARIDLGNQLLSFSTRQTMASTWSGGSDVLLRVAKPRAGAYIDRLSQNEGEHEVLLPPGFTYRVVRKSTETIDGRKFRVIDLEITTGG